MAYCSTWGECARDGMAFVPMAWEPTGGCGHMARDALRRLMRMASAADPAARSAFAQRTQQRWSVLVRREAARATLRKQFEEILPEIEKIYLDELMNTHDAREGIIASISGREPRYRNR